MKKRHLKDYKFEVGDIETLRTMVSSSYRLEVVVIYPDGHSSSHMYPLHRIEDALMMYHRRIFTALNVGLSVKVQVRLLSTELFSNVTMFEYVC